MKFKVQVYYREVTVFNSRASLNIGRLIGVFSSGYVLLLAGVRPNTEDPFGRQRRDQSGTALSGRRT